MDIRDRKAVFAAADNTLSSAPNLKRLIFLHTAVSAVVLLAVTALSYVLQNQIGSTGGLAGMGMRSALSTASTVLQMAANLALPFWTIGYAAIILRTLQGEQCDDKALLTGFVHFGPVVRLMLTRELLVMALAMLLSYPSMMLFMATPWARPLLEQVLLSPEATMDTDAMMAAIEPVILPMVAVFLGVFLLAAVPLFFRLRFTELALMEDPGAGAFAAIRKSLLLTKGNFLSLLKIDIHFWWYYLLELVVAVIAYGDFVLSLLGITLPVDATVLFFGTYILHLAAQMGLHCWMKNKVDLTYGVCYRALTEAAAQPPQSKQQNVPWTY